MSETAAISRTSVASVVGVTTLATFLSNLSSTATYVASPELTQAMGISQAEAVVSVIAYLVPFAVVMPVIAKLGDFYGHKRLLLAGLGLYALASLATAVTVDPWVFLALRLVAGLGGGIMLVSMVFIARQVPTSQQGWALGVWRAALLSGTVAGPPLGGYLAAAWGWPAIFWVTGLAGLAATVWAAVALSELLRHRTGRFDWVGAVAFTVSFSALVIGLAAAGLLRTMAGGASAARGTSLQTLSTAAPVLFAVFAALVVLVVNQRRNPTPLFRAALWRNRAFLVGNVGTFLVCTGMFAAMMFISLQLRNLLDLAPEQASHALVGMAAAAILFGIWGGPLTTRFGAAAPWAGGFVLTALAFVALTGLTAPAASIAWLFALAALSGVGQGLPLAPTTVAALAEVPKEATAEATGWFDFSHNIGRAVAIGALGALFTPADPASYTTIFAVSAVAMAAGAALVLALPRSLRRPASQHPTHPTEHA